MKFLTSGSSGAAKTILRRSKDISADAEAILANFFSNGNSPSQRVVGTVPLDHFYGHLWRKVLPETAGWESASETYRTVEGVANECARGGGVILVTTPSFLEKALDHPLFASLRGLVEEVISSGSPLHSTTAFAVEEAIGIRPLEIFGSTETGTVAARRRRNGEEWTLMGGVNASTNTSGCLVVDSPWATERHFVMSDAVRFTGPRQFLLLGRTDRRVKILEEFVSLDSVERVFSTHPYVASCRAVPWGASPQRIGLLVALSPHGANALASGTYASLCRELREALLPRIGHLAFPRRIRFVHALPADDRGKTPEKAVVGTLSEWCQEPVITSWYATNEALNATLVFPPDCRCFEGHFPSIAILPGVAQLFFLRHFARQVFSDFPDTAAWTRLKFRKPVFPGKEITLSIRRSGAGLFTFEMRLGDDICSSGAVEETEA